jgi:serine protease Do
MSHPLRSIRTLGRAILLILVAALLLAAEPATPLKPVSTPTPPAAKTPDPKAQTLLLLSGKREPATAADLKTLEDHFVAVSKKALESTVAIRVASGNGSGVIISQDGYVLTAGHVIGSSGRRVMVTLKDGRRLAGKTLGIFRTADAGLIKLDKTELPLPVADMGDAKSLSLGAWALAVGHSGGPQPGRNAPVRMGRVLLNKSTTMITDCALVGGDSGGPLFGLDGKVIGIHSRIGNSLQANLHVPINVYVASWERLKKGEVWGTSGKLVASPRRSTRPPRPYLGIGDGELADGGPILGEIKPDSAAEKAGLKVGDEIVHFGKTPVNSYTGLTRAIYKHKPGDEVVVRLKRDGELIQLTVKLGSR